MADTASYSATRPCRLQDVPRWDHECDAIIVGFGVSGACAAIEASMAGMSPSDADRIASLCRRFDLLASMGSDFHDPAVPWNPLGRWLKLAAGLEPVTKVLTTARR